MTVSKMSEKSKSSLHTSPEDALKDALDTLGNEGAFKNCKKLLILALDDTEGNYNISYINAGMKSSEMVALCDISKTLFKQDMGY
ncbi:hypothetical protein vBAcoSR7M_19 [Alteromonas phage vB_AcoS-R7M]|uniref:Uncharacterized protein n=1 Tax=Alteromonas phage vB_AcoS-R7M TaxID=2729541 RepID=A0A6M3YNL0_9CAUD|nr:hypothetical protein HWD34_gp19 [Alteromonas phage vB_AcoS-R7M]QJI53341.1 hypothetical protein vBAcoSR7M_19 [Alteromonas phage vB_AcoS-R7M]